VTSTALKLAVQKYLRELSKLPSVGDLWHLRRWNLHFRSASVGYLKCQVLATCDFYGVETCSLEVLVWVI